VSDVINRTIADATAILEAQGFVVKLAYEPHANTGTVLEQDPSGGTKVPKGSIVTLLVDATEP